MVQKRLMTWRVTLRSRERVVITHYYRDALMATVLKHSDEILDQGTSLSHRGLPGPEENDLMLAKAVVDRMIGNLDFSTYKDSYRRQVVEAVGSQPMGQIPSPSRQRPVAETRNLAEALERAAESLR